jgi:endonuclease/exonuclease/phosphatase family metal-dependent hydrolase
VERELRVGTYNLYLGADLLLLLGDRTPDELAVNSDEVRRQLGATAFPGRVDAIARVLARERLDLVGLQEVCEWRVDGALLWDFAALLCDKLERLGEPYDVVVAHATFGGSGDLAVAGRTLQVELSGSNVVLRRRSSSVRVMDTSTGSYERVLSIAALGRLGFEIGRGWCAARCELGGAGFTFVTTHTEAHDPGSRDGQRDELVASLPEDGPVVLVGDFNAEPETVGMAEGGFVDAWVAAGHASDSPEGATSGQAPDLRNEESTLDHRIDYVWVRGAEVRECARFGSEPEDRTAAGSWPSDHAGVAATVLLPG